MRPSAVFAINFFDELICSSTRRTGRREGGRTVHKHTHTLAKGKVSTSRSQRSLYPEDAAAAVCLTYINQIVFVLQQKSDLRLALLIWFARTVHNKRMTSSVRSAKIIRAARAGLTRFFYIFSSLRYLDVIRPFESPFIYRCTQGPITTDALRTRRPNTRESSCIIQ